MAAAASPALPAFSYAQAAKGLAPAISATHSQAESSVNTPEISSSERKSPIPGSEKLESLQTTAGAEKSEEISNDVATKMVHHDAEIASTVKSNSDKNSSTSTKQISSSHPDSKHVSESTSPSLVASVATLPPEDEYPSTPNGTSESWDKQSETSAIAEKSTQMTEGGKDKIGDDQDWVNVSAPKSEKDLKAAPIPAVNIWQQRKEAQEAKAKASTPLRSSVAIPAPNKSKPQNQTGRHMEAQGQDDGTKRRPSGKLADKGDGISKKKPADDTKVRDDGKCSFLRSKCCLLSLFVGKRLSRPGKVGDPDKDSIEPSTAPPPVADAAFWPTPDTANLEERKKSQSQSQSQSQEKGDSKSPGMKPNQKWVPVPYVPSAKFNTPLPTTVSRRGGRPARGSREGGNRGGHISQGSIGEKTEKMRSMGPPPIPKQNLEQQRGREQETLSGSRATSAPTQGRRAASVGPSFTDQGRSAQAAQSDRGTLESKKRASSERQDTGVAALSAGKEEGARFNKPRADSRSFSRQSSSSSYPAGTYDGARHVSGESHAHPRSYAGTERRNTYAEIDRQSEVSGRREGRESNKDIPRTRDFEFKTESWRDRESTGDRPEQRNSRGRGGYRGRGTHPTYAAGQPNQTHAFTAPLPQQPFSGGKPHALGERHRQTSAPYAGVPTQTNHRGASRSQSIPTHGIYPGGPNNFGSPLSPVQTDMHGMFGGYSTMYPGIMSAMPYNAALEPMALMSMVSAQLDYYFSIENLCKDMYLRTHMDSQGWVPLTVIAGFNRIRSLTEDMNLIRHVCQMSRNIEFRPADDGTDRLRKLDKWEQWILDLDQRQSHAQNDGPPPLQENHSPPHLNSIFPSMSQMPSPTWTPGAFYNEYAEVPNFNAAGAPSENQIFSAPIPATLPEIPPSEDFSLTNGRAELSPGQSADVPGSSTLAAHDQTVISNGTGPIDTGVATTNGHTPASPQEIGVENMFSNERMNELHVCVRHPTYQYQPPFISSASRTFSHGSIDGALPGGAQMANPMPSLRGGAGSPEG